MGLPGVGIRAPTVALRLVYVIFYQVLQWVRLLARRSASPGAEILILRP